MLRYKETEDIDARFSEVERIVTAWRARVATANPVARTEFNNILADLQDLAGRAAKASGRELASLRGQMSDKLGVAKEKLGSLSGDATAAARKGIDATGEVIQDRPFQAVAVAAVAGFVIGLLVSRR